MNSGLKQARINIPCLAVFLILVGLRLPAGDASTNHDLIFAPALELTDPGKALKEYLADPPSIKYIKYEQSYDQGKFGPGIATIDGSSQPGGYFIRYLTNSPYTKDVLATGASTGGEWECFPENKNITCSPRTSWSNFTASTIFPGYLNLSTVSMFGLPRPFPGRDDFVWLTQTNFSFKSPYHFFEGKLIAFDDANRVKELEFHAVKKGEDDPPLRKYHVQYSYDSPASKLPDEFIVSLESDMGQTFTTNRIVQFVTGMDSHAESGFSVQEFLPSSTSIETVYYMSNNTRYVLQTDGSLVEFKYDPAVEKMLNPPASKPAPSRLPGIVAIFGAVVVLLLLFRKWIRPKS